jgi:hypothetical protein
VASCLVRSDSLANALPHVTQRCGRDVECVTKCESRLDFLLNVLPHNGSGQTKERVLAPVLELDGEADAEAEADGEAGFTAFAAFVALVAVFFGARFLVDNAAAAVAAEAEPEAKAEAGVSDFLVLVRVLVPEFVLVFTVPLAFAFAFAFDFVFDRDPLPLVGFSSTFIVASTRCEMLIFLSNDAEEDEDEVEEGAPLDALATSAAAIS